MAASAETDSVDLSEKRIAAFAIEDDHLYASMITGRAVPKGNGHVFQYESITNPEIKELDKSLEERDLGAKVASFLAPFRGQRLDAVGLSTYGAIDVIDGIFRATPSDDENIINPNPFRFRNALKPAIGDAPLTIENDATAAAIGEYWWGAGRRGADYPPHSAFAYIWISRGVNAGIVLNGRPLGVRHRPETGHLLAHHFRKEERTDPIVWGSCTAHDRCITGMAGLRTMLERMALVPDRYAIEIAADYIAQLCGTVALTIAPAQMALGGMQMKMPWGKKLSDKIMERYLHHVTAFPFPVDNDFNEVIIPARLGINAAILGAAESARWNHISKLELD